jgi:DNA modification methylase
MEQNFQDIIIPEDRQRREFDPDKLAELANSIEARGLMHPIVLRDDGYTLVSGERRLRAMVLLHDESRHFDYCGTAVLDDGIPYTTLGALSPLEFKEAELEENVIREDLSWQEHAKAVAELHRLRTEIHGEYDRSTLEGWSATDTATEIAGSPAKKHHIQEVTTAIQLEEFLDDPIVSAARNPKEALKLIKEEKKRLHRQSRAAEFDASKTPHTLLHGSCYELLTNEKYTNSFDVILTDPPYGIDIDKVKFWDGDKHDYKDDDETFGRVCNEFAELSFRVAADQAHAYIFCDIRRFTDVFVGFELAGWDCWPMPLIWAKGNTGSFPNADFGPRRTYEAILYCNKGNKHVTAMYTDVIAINNPGKQLHPAGKPIDTYVNLLRRSVVPGDRVLDAFCGSGPIFPAASELSCIATGIELNDKYYNMAVERLETTIE